jgi:large subunit ribosomal protein L10
MSHVAAYKKEIVSQLVKDVEQYSIIGVVNMENLPAPQLQRMREKLRGKVVLFMTKKRLMKIALELGKQKKPGVEQLISHMTGMPALLFTKDNPFALYKILKDNKSNAPAKAGQIAPKDIIVPAGPTSFAPGPVIGELGALGVKTQVEAGKIVIRADTLVCRQGEPIKDKLAAMLTRLGIEPMEVGLDLTVVYENGMLFTKKVLDIDEKQFRTDLANALASAMGLALGIAYISAATINSLLAKAHSEARAVALGRGIFTADTVKDLLHLAEMQMQSLKAAGS